METSYGSFQRVIALPFTPEPESCEAHFDKGVLRLRIAKPKDARAQARRIEIRSGAQQESAGAQAKTQAQQAGEGGAKAS